MINDLNRFVIGITGFPGSGKTTLSAKFADKGFTLIDMDVIGHDLLENDNEVIRKLIDAFGKEICCPGFDDSDKDSPPVISRKQLALKTFWGPKENLDLLNNIMFSFMAKEAESILATPEVKNFVIDGALLFERGFDCYCDMTIFLDVPFEERLRRVAESRKWSEDTLRRIDEAQSIEAKRKATLIVKEYHP